MREIPLTVLRGFLMGAADIVPGVSGGTVALVLGIYRRLIGAIRTGSQGVGRLARGDVAGFVEHLKAVDWVFLGSLLAGIGTAVVLLAGLIDRALRDRPVEMAGLFLGLVAGSVVVAWRLMRTRTSLHVSVLGGVAVVAFVLLGLREETSTLDETGSAPLWAFLGAGALAICAMILPGVSGSFILVLLGMYGAVLGAVHDRDLPPLLLFGLGCVVGLAVFSQVLHWALEQYHDLVMAALIGLMAGSTRVLWPWPLGVDSTALDAPFDPVAVPILLALGSCVVVVAFDRFATARS